MKSQQNRIELVNRPGSEAVSLVLSALAGLEFLVLFGLFLPGPGTLIRSGVVPAFLVSLLR